MKTTWDSTAKNYYSIWKRFNSFIIWLDKKPKNWEQRLSLYGAFLVDSGVQSTTIRSYFSAIKKILNDANCKFCFDNLLLNTLTRACKMVNDTVSTRLPIKSNLLEVLLFELERLFDKQFYLLLLYQSIFLLGYYGLFRISELTQGQHVVKAKDINIGLNKNKILIVLYSSKTHSKESRPQKVKIAENADTQLKRKRFFCPFQSLRKFMKLHGPYTSDKEQLFIFRDKSPVTPQHARKVLDKILVMAGLDKNLYSFHGLSAGWATELINLGYSIETVKLIGRWKSNAVY